MKIRYSQRLSQISAFAFGLCVATTALARDDDSERSSASKNSDSSSHKSGKSKPHTAKNADGASDTDAKSSGKSGAKSDDKSDEDQSTDEDRPTKAPKKSQKSAETIAAADVSDSAMSFALLGSFGAGSDNTRGGLGLRGGVHIGEGTAFYFGGIGTYFFGSSQTTPTQLGTPGSSSKRSFMYLGAEAGLDLPVLRDVTMRPYFGLGLGRAADEACGGDGNCGTNASYPLTITPGVAGFYEIAGGFFVGGDIRYLIAAGASSVSSPILTATVGMKF